MQDHLTTPEIQVYMTHVIFGSYMNNLKCYPGVFIISPDKRHSQPKSSRDMERTPHTLEGQNQ